MAARSTIFFGAAGVLALGAAVAAVREKMPNLIQSGRSEPASVPTSDLSPELAPDTGSRDEPQTAVAVATAAAAQSTAAAIRRDESSLMVQLHELGEANPPLSLQLAREGNDRFPGTAEAPERGWILVKSLVNMRRFDEAKAEAAILVEEYRGTSWAADVERHLLATPLYPTEEGDL